MSSRQIDHSHFSEKLQLRIDKLPEGSPLRVLDLFGGNGLLWEEVRKRTSREIEVLRIDKTAGKKGFYLIGDNRKFLLEYGDFDVVDLDGGGCPFAQLERVLSASRAPKVIFLTWIQERPDKLPAKFLYALGYEERMVKKNPALFARRGQDKLLEYLALKGVKKVKMCFTPDRRKTYLSIKNGGKA